MRLQSWKEKSRASKKEHPQQVLRWASRQKCVGEGAARVMHHKSLHHSFWVLQMLCLPSALSRTLLPSLPIFPQSFTQVTLMLPGSTLTSLQGGFPEPRVGLHLLIEAPQPSWFFVGFFLEYLSNSYLPSSTVSNQKPPPLSCLLVEVSLAPYGFRHIS